MARTADAEWMTVSRAARATGASEQTVERWMDEKLVESRWVTVGQRGVRLLRRDTLPPSSGESEAQHVEADTPLPSETHGSTEARPREERRVAWADAELRTAAERAVIEERLAGYRLAIKLHAQLRANAERERVRLECENEFLRAQLSSRTEAEYEVRLLLANTQRLLTEERERQALQAERSPWWMFWR